MKYEFSRHQDSSFDESSLARGSAHRLTPVEPKRPAMIMLSYDHVIIRSCYREAVLGIFPSVSLKQARAVVEQAVLFVGSLVVQENNFQAKSNQQLEFIVFHDNLSISSLLY